MDRFYTAVFVVVICRCDGDMRHFKGKTREWGSLKAPFGVPFVTFRFPQDPKVPFRKHTECGFRLFAGLPLFCHRTYLHEKHKKTEPGSGALSQIMAPACLPLTRTEARTVAQGAAPRAQHATGALLWSVARSGARPFFADTAAFFPLAPYCEMESPTSAQLITRSGLPAPYELGPYH